VIRTVVALFLAAVAAQLPASAAQAEDVHPSSSFDAARALFYNGQYAEAAALSGTLTADDERLAISELRTSALLFQLRRTLGEPADKAKALKACSTCPELLRAFTEEFTAGQSAAKDVLREHPKDPNALFFLGKLDLNYVWLVLGTLGRRTGWNEYWEARHSLDAALELEPEYLRARTARAWIDYIVDTRMPWGTGWLLGGGNRKKALSVMREASQDTDDFYDTAEALFGLWDMQLREKNKAGALESAKRLAVMFPNNQEVARFVAAGRK